MRKFIFFQITLKTFSIRSTSHDSGKDNSPLYKGISPTNLKPLNICDDTISSNITFSTPALSDLSETGGLVDHNPLNPLATTFNSNGEMFPPQVLISLYPPKMDKNVTINGTILSSMELKITVAAYRGTCKDILHAAEVSLSVNQPMLHISLNPYAKPFLSLQYNPLLYMTL